MASGNSRQIQIVTGKHLTLEVEPADTIKDVKAMLQDKEGVPPDQQMLSFIGALVEEVSTNSIVPPTHPQSNNTVRQGRISDPGRACASEIVSSILEQIVSEAFPTQQKNTKPIAQSKPLIPGELMPPRHLFPLFMTQPRTL